MKYTASADETTRQTAFIGISNSDRREHRRHDLEQQAITVERWDGHRRAGEVLGKIVDISAGGVRIRTEAAEVKPDQHIRVRVALPTYAGISPFTAPSTTGLQPKGDWVGWMTVARVISLKEGQKEVAGRLVDMDEMDRGMLGLYLSTQPLAA
jgi:hypothetical protein